MDTNKAILGLGQFSTSSFKSRFFIMFKCCWALRVRIVRSESLLGPCRYYTIDFRFKIAKLGPREDK